MPHHIMERIERSLPGGHKIVSSMGIEAVKAALSGGKPALRSMVSAEQPGLSIPASD